MGEDAIGGDGGNDAVYADEEFEDEEEDAAEAAAREKRGEPSASAVVRRDLDQAGTNEHAGHRGCIRRVAGGRGDQWLWRAVTVASNGYGLAVTIATNGYGVPIVYNPLTGLEVRRG